MWLATTMHPPSAGILVAVDPRVGRRGVERRPDHGRDEVDRPAATGLHFPDRHFSASLIVDPQATRPDDRIDCDVCRVLRRDPPGQAARARQVAPARPPRRPATRPRGRLRARHRRRRSSYAGGRRGPRGHRRLPLRARARRGRLRGDPRRGQPRPQRHPAPGGRRGGAPLAGRGPRGAVRRPARPRARRPRRRAARGGRADVRPRRRRHRHDRVRRTARPLRTPRSVPGRPPATSRRARTRWSHRPPPCASTSTTWATSAAPWRWAWARTPSRRWRAGTRSDGGPPEG